MAEKRKAAGTSDKRKRKYLPDGTQLWSKRTIDGPGIWVTCVKGKEKQTVGELMDVFESLASELWPIVNVNENTAEDGEQDSEEDDEDMSIEDQIAKEVASIKRPRKEQKRFASCQTNTPCVVFLSCKSPIDPVKLVVTHVKNVQRTGITNTRYTHRLVPVSGTCVTNIPEIKSLCERIFASYFSSQTEGTIHKYKIDLRVRNHNTISRPLLIQAVASCVPEGHVVDLVDPDVHILVEVFKSVCGVSIVEDYYRLQKFNIMELANLKNGEGKFKPGEGRVPDLDNLKNSTSDVAEQSIASNGIPV